MAVLSTVLASILSTGTFLPAQVIIRLRQKKSKQVFFLLFRTSNFICYVVVNYSVLCCACYVVFCIRVCYAMLYSVVWCAMLCCILDHGVLCYVVFCIMVCYARLYSVLCCSRICCILYHGVLYYAVLWCAMFCCIMYFGVLC